ncbi:MAG: GH116 family glycosyl hydrolase, partial [Eubacteriales bacterium]|nr:GH116 family glycosyl hydrolase [Eubacteriales bacterium]
GSPSLTAFNPFIPLNDFDSGIPAAFFEVAIENDTDAALDYSAAMTLCNPYDGSVNTFVTGGDICALHMTQNIHKPDSTEFGDMTLSADTSGAELSYQQYWYRGGWFDHLETYWCNFKDNERFSDRRYDTAGRGDHGTLCLRRRARPGERVIFRFVIAWNRPNCHNYWSPYKRKNAEGLETDVTWKNYYATVFEDSLASSRYAMKNFSRLRSETFKYKEILWSSTLPDEVVEALASATSVLKSPTVLRLEGGEVYGWEGVGENTGSCEGTCTHVWNYAYAMPFLFAKLERGLRETDFRYNQDENGKMSFRLALPLGRERNSFRACVDGQMGGVIKTYREWKLSGDTEWLRGVWQSCKKSLEYAWSDKNYDKWDLNRDGVLEGRQHHTLDMELFGPSSWLEGFYLAALKAGAEMAYALGESDSADYYMKLFSRGRRWSNANLWNGEYFMQKIDLEDKGVIEPYGDTTDAYWNEETGEIKYQIGEGCEIDQLCAQWHADICGLGSIFDGEKVKKALRSLYKYNFKPSMREHYNSFRIYALNDEAAAIMCAYPEHVRLPSIPIPYAQESMHGFEYQLAALMMSNNMIEEGVNIVRAIRDRYNGKKRNPWNEIEWGSNYARSMASFSMIPLLSGFRFDMTEPSVAFDPKINRDDFSCFWSVDSGWGSVKINCSAHSALIELAGGVLKIKKLGLPFTRQIDSVSADGKNIPFTYSGGYVVLDEETAVRDSLKVF